MGLDRGTMGSAGAQRYKRGSAADKAQRKGLGLDAGQMAIKTASSASASET